MANELKVEVIQVSESTSKALIREHSVLVDRPTAKGGADLGPMGGELFLAAVGGCFMSNLLAAIKTREAGVSQVRTEVTGRIIESPARFDRIEVVVHAEGGGEDSLEKLVRIAERGCIMMNTLRGHVEVLIRISAPVAG